MAELTAEMIQRGRGPAAGDVARRRQTLREIRAAREKLTSSTGLERAFDYELVRLFAQYRVGAAVPLFALFVAIASASMTWTPLRNGLVGFSFVLSCMGATLGLSRWFLRRNPDEVPLNTWRRRFVLAELVQGASWVLVVHDLAQTQGPAGQSFLVFILLIVAAITATLSATIPAAVYAGFVPLSAWAVGCAAAYREPDTIILALMTVSAHAFFMFLADRLYSSALTNVHARAEKDALVAELEQAKANSDEARRRAEEANLAKSRFLATMSHELRTPLNAILGFSEVMKNEVFGPHASTTYREYSGDIHGSGQHLLTLINEILDLSRIEAGRYELNEEAVHLAHIVDDCRHMMNLRAKAKNQAIRDAIDPSLPRLWADERAIRQIVLNLLSNAIKFTPPGGEIVIKVGWTSSGGQYVSVKDTGPGIPEDEIPIVMSSFGRGSLAIKAAEQGSGLGLPIVKGLVDLHGGGFRLNSRPREGTEVIVTFPALRAMSVLPAVEVLAAGAPSQAA
jgi:two-component system, cell cycle sensor histidine kinase PleC